jgi:hypothetical protein
MTATTPIASRFTFRDDAEREQARVMAARLLVRQAKLLKHDVDPEIAAVAQRPLPDESRRRAERPFMKPRGPTRRPRPGIG